MRDMPVLSLRDVTLRFGARTLLDDVELHVNRFDKVTLVGQNGCGKSTMLKVMGGVLDPDFGDVYVEPGLKIAYVPQDSVFEEHHPTIRDYFQELLPTPELFYKAQNYADALGVDLDRPWDGLSGGERRRISLVSAFMQEADLLLLDEPTNHLDLEAIQWLERFLLDFRGACVVISHDRTFLENITNTVLWLDRGKVRRLEKGFQHFEAWQETLIEQEMKQTERMGKLLEKEQHWLLRGVTARRKRNQGRLRRLEELREVRGAMLTESKAIAWGRPKEIPASRVVMEAFHLSKSYGDRVLIKDFSTRILKGDRIGIIGPNGGGKSTLLKMLTGGLAPDVGHVKFGKQNEVVYLDQQRSDLVLTKTVKEILCPSGGDQVGVGEARKHVVGYLKEFLFTAEHLDAPVGTLSGGERNRLLLARALSLPSSVLVLDEPTNDLDMDTLDKLQAMLDDYPGTLLIVSHDRSFLDQTVSSIIAFEGDGRVVEYAGGYQDYMRAKGRLEKVKKTPPPLPVGKGKERMKEPLKRLSFNQSYRLEVIPGELEKLTAEMVALEAKLHDPELYSRDPKLFQKISGDFKTKSLQKIEMEQEWMELAMLQEELQV